MQLDRKYFFDNYRKTFGKLSQNQVESIECIFDEFETSGYNELRWLAYMLATTYHETAATMLPIEEIGKGKNRKYGSRIKHSGVAYSAIYGIMYGRGYVQLTWFENYELMGRLLGVDLLKKPELALRPRMAARIMLEGMTKGSSSIGDFTGRSLEQYFNSEKEDPIGARRIINGTDKAEKIAGYYYELRNFLKLESV